MGTFTGSQKHFLEFSAAKRSSFAWVRTEQVHERPGKVL
jgi:hypothetical protein